MCYHSRLIGCHPGHPSARETRRCEVTRDGQSKLMWDVDSGSRSWQIPDWRGATNESFPIRQTRCSEPRYTPTIVKLDGDYMISRLVKLDIDITTTRSSAYTSLYILREGCQTDRPAMAHAAAQGYPRGTVHKSWSSVSVWSGLVNHPIETWSGPMTDACSSVHRETVDAGCGGQILHPYLWRRAHLCVQPSRSHR